MKKRNTVQKILSLALVAAMTFVMTACGDDANVNAAQTTGSTTPSSVGANSQPVENSAQENGTQESGVSDAAEYDTIVMVWYPNESAADYDAAREEYGRLIEEATGKKVEHKLTTDYAIAIEAVASGTAQICFMGAQGYVEAKNKNDAVMPLFVNSGESGTLDDAIYYSWLAVNTGDESQYAVGEGEYSMDNIAGKKVAFVSNSSTSGFKVPTSSIITYFSQKEEWKDITSDDLIEGGSGMFFSEVLFGGSHQGSAVNLLSEKSDIAAFCNTEMAPYANLVSGEENKMNAVYEIKADASAPFDTLTGRQFVIIQSTPVLNGPFAYNAETLNADDVQKIQELFTSEEVAQNPLMFVPADSEEIGMFKKKGNEKFLLVEDSWYDPIRELSE